MSVSVPFRFSIYTAIRSVLRSLSGGETLPEGTVILVLPAGKSARTGLWTVLWAAGAALAGAWFLTAWLRGRRRFQDAEPAEDPFVRWWLGENSLS